MVSSLKRIFETILVRSARAKRALSTRHESANGLAMLRATFALFRMLVRPGFLFYRALSAAPMAPA
ncbi:MAG: hypothetical protein ACI362_08410, partial [Coriobacteriales bacterium]